MSMTLTATKGGEGGFAKAPPGNHPARLVAFVDLGTQENDFAGEVTQQHRAYFVWELVCEEVPGTKGRNFTLGIDLTLSLNEKAKLRKWIEARTGKAIPDGTAYPIETELGQPCLLNVAHNANGYPKIVGVSAVPKGMSVPEAQNKTFTFNLDEFLANGVCNIPPFVPFMYGKPIADIIRQAKEVVGSGKTGALDVPQGTKTAATTPASPPPPPRRQPTTIKAEMSRPKHYWLDTGSGEPTLHTEEDLKVMLADAKFVLADAMLTGENESDWTPAIQVLPALEHVTGSGF